MTAKPSCPCPETLLLAQRLAIVAALPETGAWIIVDGSSVASLYLDLIDAHRGPAVRNAVRFYVAWDAEAARQARLDGGVPVFRAPAFVERCPERPAAAKPGPWQKAAAAPAAARRVVLVGKPEHVELLLELLGYGFALDDLIGLDLETLERLAVQAEIAAALLDAYASAARGPRPTPGGRMPDQSHRFGRRAA